MQLEDERVAFSLSTNQIHLRTYHYEQAELQQVLGVTTQAIRQTDRRAARRTPVDQN
jgi:hypothetical protein